MRYKNSFCSLLGAMALLFCGAAVAQAQPANDNFANGQALTGTFGNVTGDNTFASKEQGEPNHAGSIGNSSIWYRWQPTYSGPVTFDTAGSSIDTVLAIYVGSAVDTITEITSNDDNTTAGNTTSLVKFSAVANTVYYIAVDSASYPATTKAGEQGSVQLTWNQRYKVSGIVKTNTSPTTNLSGVIISLSGASSSNSGTSASTTTDASGTYTISNMLPGNYTIVPTKMGYTFAPETLTINVSKDSTGNDFTATKIPDPVLPELYISDVAVREGNAGNSFVTFNVAMNVASKDAVTVFFATANGTANSSNDYKGLKGTFTFPAGTTTMTIDVGLRPDAVVETDETFTMKISGAEGAKIVKALGTAIILNDDLAPSSGASSPTAKLPTRIRVARADTHRN